MDATRYDPSHAALRSLIWITLVAASSLMLSRAFACALPFAAIAAVTASKMGRRDAVLAVLLAWVGNQTVGFVLLHYPHTWDTLAWGGAIGLAAFAAALAATAASPLAKGTLTRAAATLLGAFIVYEAVLFAMTLVLPSAGNPFAPWIVARIFEVNVLGSFGLLILHEIAVGLGLLQAAPKSPTALAWPSYANIKISLYL